MHARPRVQRAPGLPCALSLEGRLRPLILGRMNLQNSGGCRRENAKVYPLSCPPTGRRRAPPDDRLRRASSIPRRQRWNRELAAYWIPAFAGMTALDEASSSGGHSPDRWFAMTVVDDGLFENRIDSRSSWFQYRQRWLRPRFPETPLRRPRPHRGFRHASTRRRAVTRTAVPAHWRGRTSWSARIPPRARRQTATAT
jgi:hypothetical protein